MNIYEFSASVVDQSRVKATGSSKTINDDLHESVQVAANLVGIDASYASDLRLCAEGNPSAFNTDRWAKIMAFLAQLFTIIQPYISTDAKTE